MHGLGCNILACDPVKKLEIEKMGIPYVPMNELFPGATFSHCIVRSMKKLAISSTAASLHK